MSTATMSTKELLERLQRHYIKPSNGLTGGIFVPEVGFNGGFGAGRRCDAIYAGFTSASGRLLVGHELKVSRSDWLSELAHIGKADAWADQCHEWWLVTLPGVVQDGELPDGWGLMVPGTSKTRMKIITPARRHPDRVPSWDAVRSVMARQDTLRANAAQEERDQAHHAARVDMEAELSRRIESALRLHGNDADIRKELDTYREALGGSLVDSDRGTRWGRNHTRADLAELSALLKASNGLQNAMDRLVGRYGSLRTIRNDFDALDKAARQAADIATAHGGGGDE